VSQALPDEYTQPKDPATDDAYESGIARPVTDFLNRSIESVEIGLTCWLSGFPARNFLCGLPHFLRPGLFAIVHGDAFLEMIF